jgi:hypothetical protein
MEIRKTEGFGGMGFGKMELNWLGKLTLWLQSFLGLGAFAPVPKIPSCYRISGLLSFKLKML